MNPVEGTQAGCVAHEAQQLLGRQPAGGHGEVAGRGLRGTRGKHNAAHMGLHDTEPVVREFSEGKLSAVGSHNLW